MKKRIGFIGLGIMGRPMSLNLIRAGYDVSVYDINQTAVMSLADAGARGAASPKEVAEHSDVIFTMLPNSEHVRTVITGEQGVLAGANTGSIIIDMSLNLAGRFQRAWLSLYPNQACICWMRP